MKRWQTSLVIKEMHIKTIRYHLTPIRVAIILKKIKKQNTGVGENVAQLEPLYIAAGNGK